jgi:hypothetical protein
MPDNDTTPTDSPSEPVEATSSPEKQAEPASAATEQVTAPVRKKKKKKSQAYLVWIGIVFLVGGAFAGWRAADRKAWFEAGANNLSIMRNEPALKQWTDKLRQYGGPTCLAIVEMLTGEQLPPLLKEKGVNNFDDLALLLAEGGKLYEECRGELTDTYNLVAWILALAGLGMILLDILREKGILPGRKPK